MKKVKNNVPKIYKLQHTKHHIMYTHIILCTHKPHHTHTYIPHYAHTHITSCTHNRHSKSHRHTFWLIKLKKILDLFFRPSALSALTFLNFQILVLPSTSFCPDHLHYHWKSNSLVLPVILSEYGSSTVSRNALCFWPLFYRHFQIV